MSTESLRNELIAWIGKLDDQGLLKALLGLKKLLGSGGTNALTEEERAAIHAKLDARSGREEDHEFWTKLAASGLARSYGSNEPDISGITLLEHNPQYGK
ncbi:MAG: hypothetical protein H6592_13300 [Flavobacteriales bacterium]|nr:hypothetical protein [Flavobacteriales bacterium]HPF89846.1 hypothetical protein [Flavobacteriales bacterium]